MLSRVGAAWAPGSRELPLSLPPPLHPSLSPSVAHTRPQANIGDNTAPKPGMLDFKGKAKWEAYSKNKGMSKDEAMENYIAKVAELQEA